MKHPGPSGRHRHVDRWNRLVRLACLLALVVIGAVQLAYAGGWAVALTGLALAVAVIALSVDG